MGETPLDAERKGHAAAAHALATAGAINPAPHDDRLDWSRLLDEMPAVDGGAKHRRTYSAPPVLTSLHVAHPGLAGKRAVRSPHAGYAGLALGVSAAFDPFHDVRSPVYKKHLPADQTAPASEDSSFVSTEAPSVRHGERGTAGRRARSHSFDLAALQLQHLGDAPLGATKARGFASAKRADLDAPADGGEKEAPARDLKTVPWTSAEDKVICEGVELHGYKWSLISLSLPGRTDNAVRNRWHRLEQARRWREEVQAQYQAANGDGAPPNSAVLPGSAFPGYKCRRCGQPKRGHVCPYEEASQPPRGRAPQHAPHARAPKAERKAGAQAEAPADLALHRAQPHAGLPLVRRPEPEPASGSAGGRGAQPPALQRPSLQRPESAQYITVMPPTSVVDVRAAMGQMPTPSPQRYLLEHLGTMPLSAHLRNLESGLDGDIINVGDLEDLIFGQVPLEISDLSANSPLHSLAFSPRRFARANAGPPPLASIPSGEPTYEAPATSIPGLERQTTPQAVHAS